jgi:hypothetical protein
MTIDDNNFDMPQNCEGEDAGWRIVNRGQKVNSPEAGLIISDVEKLSFLKRQSIEHGIYLSEKFENS